MPVSIERTPPRSTLPQWVEAQRAVQAYAERDASEGREGTLFAPPAGPHRHCLCQAFPLRGVAALPCVRAHLARRRVWSHANAADAASAPSLTGPFYFFRGVTQDMHMERKGMWLSTFYYRDGENAATFNSAEEAAKWWCARCRFDSQRRKARCKHRTRGILLVAFAYWLPAPCIHTSRSVAAGIPSFSHLLLSRFPFLFSAQPPP